MMMAAAKKIDRDDVGGGLTGWRGSSCPSWFRSRYGSARLPSSGRRSATSRRKIASTMITVASTIRPKSMAPTDSRLADSPRSTRMLTAKNSANGMVAPTISALRRSPRKHPLQQHDQQNADHHVVQHGAGRDVDQVLAVVDALDVHAGRQDAGVVDAFDQLLDARDGRRALLAAPHQHDALHDVVVLVAGRRCRAAAACRR